VTDSAGTSRPQAIPRVHTIPRIHIVGRRNAGKTTLVCELVLELTGRGFRVATIKHTHHQHELDTPGKDSFRHRQAGAAAVGILSPHMVATFVPVERDSDQGDDPYACFDSVFSHQHLVIVEGDLHCDATKIEMWRSAVQEPPYAAQDASICAVVTDDTPECQCPRWPRADVVTVASRILQIAGLPDFPQ
jgi:molybdopterin-guanine dinucleotide biosynthesis protein MobB